MEEKKNPGVRRAKKPTPPKFILSENNLEICGLILFGLVVILIIGLIDFRGSNLMGIFVHRGMEPLIGIFGVFFLLPSLSLLCMSFMVHRRNRVFNALAQYSLFISLLILPAINLSMKILQHQFFHPDDNAKVGIIGTSIATAFEALFGKSGGIVVLGIFGLILLPPVTGYAPSEIVSAVVKFNNRRKKKEDYGFDIPIKPQDIFDDYDERFDPPIKGFMEDYIPSSLPVLSSNPCEVVTVEEEKPPKKADVPINPEEIKQMEFNFKKMLREIGEFKFPDPEILNAPVNGFAEADKKILAKRIETTLADFGVDARVEDMVVGPVIIRCELRPAPGVRVNAIKNLRDELAMALSAKALRIEAPIPGRDVMGIEFPNGKKKMVTLREMLESDEFQTPQSLLTICIGKDLAGKPIIEDLSKMPHLLIAGQTGAGKSVCLNSIIMSILFKTAPDEVKLILIDPKRVEMTLYEGLPHLIVPVVQEWRDAKNCLIWVAKEMSARLEKLQKTRCRDIATFNKKRPNGEFLPFIVIVIDEFATLMDLANGKEVERLINHLARLARATGIHLILATQRPDVKVITGSIKANIPARIAFSVPSQVDSKTILDRAGADLLLGEGDMLYRGPRDGAPRRAQGAFVADEEIEKVVGFLMEQLEPEYNGNVLEEQGEISDLEGITPDEDDDYVAGFDDDEDAEYFGEAMKLLLSKKRISASMIQRELRIGYNRASRIIDKMEEKGVITGWDGQRSRRLVEGNDFYESIGDI